MFKPWCDAIIFFALKIVNASITFLLEKTWISVFFLDRVYIWCHKSLSAFFWIIYVKINETSFLIFSNWYIFVWGTCRVFLRPHTKTCKRIHRSSTRILQIFTTTYVQRTFIQNIPHETVEKVRIPRR
jgi:hypothetical protein